MSRTPISKSLILSPGALALFGQTLDALVSIFPTERCREMIKLLVAEDYAELTREETEELKALSLLTGEDMNEPPSLTPEENAKYIEEEEDAAVYNIITSWLEVLYRARVDAGEKPVRLDSSLLPPPELARQGGHSWDSWLTDWFGLTAEQIGELMALYAAKLVPVFDLMIANNPDGFKLTGDILVGKDSAGFYLLPKTGAKN